MRRRTPARSLPRRLTPTVAALLLLLGGCAPEPGVSHAPDPEERASSSTLIRDALVLDGTGAPGRSVDVRLRGDRIIDVGDLLPAPGDDIVDADGLVLAPGFIDTHSHHDRALLEIPDALGAVSQGITTIVAGNDGGSSFPLADFFRRIEETGVAVNVASYTGHGTIRRRVLGDDFRREATPAEIDSMAVLLRRDLDAGSLGLSTGLEYDPGIYATTEEVIALARVAAEAGGRYISHMRSEDRALLDAIDELIRVGREADIPVQVSHMKLAMKSLWGRADEVLERLDRARAAGIDVTADVYPYTYWQSTMTVLFPDRDFTDREAAAFALEELVPPAGMLIARYEAEPSYEGLTLDEVARRRGEDPVTAYLGLIQRAEAAGADESIIATSMAEEDVVRLLRWPHTNVASDGGLDGAHPRGFGAFTRVLGPMVRRGDLTLPQAVHKMTGLSASHVGIRDRGVIRPGAFADLVLFDPATVTDRATPERPHAVSERIRAVWVNGVVVYRDGQTTGERPGRVVRRPADGRDESALGGPANDRGRPIDRGRPEIDRIFADYDTRETPGCALGVIRGDALSYHAGYGMADLEHDVPITASSVFRIGSVSKQFSAAATVLLAQDGVISLDDPVRRWIPELPDYGEAFTIRRLLHHTSGARDYLMLMTLAGSRDDDWYSDDDVVRMLARQPATNFDPGTDHLYSNSGYFLLSQIVERATGETLAEYARERMFEPLGMTSTHFHDGPTRLVPGRAVGHAPTDDGFRISTTTLPMIGDGGIFTSIEDLVKWDRNLDDGAIVGGPAFVEAMHRRGVLTSGDTLDYALGLVHGTHRGLRTVSHGGSFVGFRAASLRYPDQDVSIYTLCNRADADPMRLSLEVGEVVLGERMEPAVSDAERRRRSSREAVDTLALPRARLAEYEGDYHSDELDVRYRVALDGDTLRLEVGNYLDGRLAPVGPDRFRRGPLSLEFRRNDGRVTGFELDAGRVRGIRFTRVDGRVGDT